MGQNEEVGQDVGLWTTVVNIASSLSTVGEDRRDLNEFSTQSCPMGDHTTAGSIIGKGGGNKGCIE